MYAHDDGTEVRATSVTPERVEDPGVGTPGIVLLRCVVQEPMARRIFYSAVFPYRLPVRAQWQADRKRFIDRFQAYLAPRWDLSSMLSADVVRVDGPLPAGWRDFIDGGGLDYRPVYTRWRP